MSRGHTNFGDLVRHCRENYHPPCPECGARVKHCPCCLSSPDSAWHVCTECEWEEFDAVAEEEGAV